ncbi:hypothetical protein JCM21714_20 [Gracilibacillus boraciitolerans JCM 21714]|uniref:Uncharacterized protein n=1 Tax=Gracilibacillus boraciitolerans JCM 21714 TaxID=1298598 RepID=W4VEA4_9BACI|nr:hypothetical protein [Gracilibacillus boraciitolerans]GAE91084.1 hypothetical protein JCM21714_20 [Gracilibacillus boraciitolerans JCM 21714]
MVEAGQLRVYVSKKYFPIFQEISGNNLFSQNSQFFILSVFVGGEKHNLLIPLEKKNELCRAATLSEYDKTSLRALYLKKHMEMSTLKEIVEYAEKYANGGIKYLLENILQDMVLEDTEGNWQFKQKSSKELQMKLFEYVLAMTEEVPF